MYLALGVDPMMELFMLWGGCLRNRFREIGFCSQILGLLLVTGQQLPLGNWDYTNPTQKRRYISTSWQYQYYSKL